MVERARQLSGRSENFTMPYTCCSVSELLLDHIKLMHEAAQFNGGGNSILGMYYTANFAANSNVIAAVRKGGGIPIIHLSETGHLQRPLEITVTEHHEKIRNVAISHVWSA